MTFVIAPEHRFKRRIDVRVPSDGGFRSESFTATFAAIETDTARTIYESEDPEKDRLLLERVFVAVEGIVDEGGTSLEDSPDLRARLARVPYVALPLVETYWQALSGGKAKN